MVHNIFFCSATFARRSYHAMVPFFWSLGSHVLEVVVVTVMSQRTVTAAARTTEVVTRLLAEAGADNEHVTISTNHRSTHSIGNLLVTDRVTDRITNSVVKELEDFLEQLSAEKPRLTAASVFEMDLVLLFTFVSSVTTYSMLLLQYQ